MAKRPSLPNLSEAWRQLDRDGERLASTNIGELFASDNERASKFTYQLDDLLVDFSKELIDDEAWANLLELAEAAQVASKRDAMFGGEIVNSTEQRPALHMLLRRVDTGHEDSTRTSKTGAQFSEAAAVRNDFLQFAQAIRNGIICGSDGDKFTDVINIGIGGSDLGPRMAVEALASVADGPRVHFVSNVDGSQIRDCFDSLDPARTLVIVVSKTFTTAETMRNATSARQWLASVTHPSQHMVAVSSNISAVEAFDIPRQFTFPMWDWVGGRYSIWSAAGLSLAIAVGREAFMQMLAGAQAMDRHFCEAPPSSNIPLAMALVSVWRRNIMNCTSVAVIPYLQRLGRFPAYLQQLVMESNGKSVDSFSKTVTLATSPVVWGEPGTDAQHSFFQLLHQGTDIIPVDFIMAANTRDGLPGHHEILLANCLAQGRALAFGRVAEDSELFRNFDGNRPSTSILINELNAYSLGRLIALYEHRVFVESVIWQINAFDQWGVELGKTMAKELVAAVDGQVAPPDDLDASTRTLLEGIVQRRSAHSSD